MNGPAPRAARLHAQRAAPSPPPSPRLGLRGAGHPLPEPARRTLEARLGHDFSRVRVHDDAPAHRAAESLGARAFASGEDVAFRRGELRPETGEGRRLLAHELTHVVQQRSPGGPAPGIVQCAPDDDWVKDRDGNLYYATREEAERRKAALEAQGEYSEYRVVSFEQGKKTSWRVEMRGPKEKPQPPEEEAPGGGEEGAPQAPAESRPAEPETPVEGTPATGSASKKVCLTFDDGPEDGTEQVLDVLQTKGAKGTFFLTGINMPQKDSDRQRRLIARMINEGHRIANHTFTHEPQTETGYLDAYGDLSDREKERKFNKNWTDNRAHFETLLAQSPPKFPGFTLARLPGQGRFVPVGGKHVYVEATEKLGMKHVGWDFEFAKNGDFGHLKVLDWKRVTGVAAELDRYPRNGEVVLFHDRHWKGSGGKRLLTNLLTHLETHSIGFGNLTGEGQCG